MKCYALMTNSLSWEDKRRVSSIPSFNPRLRRLFSRKTVESLQKELEELFQAHGLATTDYEGWVSVDGEMPGIAATIVQEWDHESTYSVQLDVEVAYDQDTMIVESFAGIGLSRPEAIQNAFENFCRNSYHVFLAACWGQVAEDQVSVEHWDIEGTHWEVFVGNYGIRNFGEQKVDIPEDAFPTVENLLRALPLEASLYWLRVFYSDVGNGDTVTEVLLNNEVWEEAQAAISALDWPKLDGFYSVRNFLMMRRLEEA